MVTHNKIVSLIKFFFVVVLFILILLTLQSNYFSKIMPYHDSSMFIYFGEAMNHGLIPYIDMLDHKGPVLFFINFFAVAISHFAFTHGLFLVESIFLAVDFYFLYKIAKIFVDNDYVFICSLFFLTPIIIVTFGYGNYSEG